MKRWVGREKEKDGWNERKQNQTRKGSCEQSGYGTEGQREEKATEE
jgi:hypothetical protein